MQDEAVVDFHKVFDFVFFETDESVEVGAVPARAVQAVDDVLLLLLLDEEHVEDLLLALAAVVRRLVLGPAVEAHLDALAAHELQRQLRLTKRLHQHVPVGHNNNPSVRFPHSNKLSIGFR